MMTAAVGRWEKELSVLRYGGLKSIVALVVTVLCVHSSKEWI